MVIASLSEWWVVSASWLLAILSNVAFVSAIHSLGLFLLPCCIPIIWLFDNVAFVFWCCCIVWPSCQLLNSRINSFSVVVVVVFLGSLLCCCVVVVFVVNCRCRCSITSRMVLFHVSCIVSAVGAWSCGIGSKSGRLSLSVKSSSVAFVTSLGFCRPLVPCGALMVGLGPSYGSLLRCPDWRSILVWVGYCWVVVGWGLLFLAVVPRFRLPCLPFSPEVQILLAVPLISWTLWLIPSNRLFRFYYLFLSCPSLSF